MSRLHRLLAGLRVVDLSRYLPGPLATQLLADLGADVVKVEPPGGDPMRSIGPALPDGRGLWHEAVNAGKRLVTLDLRQPGGRERLLELLDGADVLVESFRPGVMASLGLDFDTLLARNRRLVCVSLSGYGQQGPLQDRAGHDNNYLGQAGFLARVGPAPGQPTLVDPPMADCLGSLFGLGTLLAALLARERDGRGCHIDIALADVALPLQAFALASIGSDAGPAARGEGELNGGWACYGVYRTRDGREVALGAVEPKFWAAFCTAAGRPDWIARQSEPLPQHALQAEVAAFFAGLSWAELESRYAGVDCCLSPVLAPPEVVASPHGRARGLLHPAAVGPGWQAVFPAWVDGEPPRPRAPLRSS